MIPQPKAAKTQPPKALQSDVGEISKPPGEIEAKQIIHLYGIANEGLRAFVRMGFLLADVKARLPHGQYSKWIAKHLPSLSRMHLHRASYIAQSLASHFGIQIPNVTHELHLDSNVSHARHLEELPADATALIDACAERGGYRLLMGEIKALQASHPDTIQACEDLWNSSAALRDEYEPRVLGGEMTYGAALQGMTGKIHTKGKPKSATDHSQRLAQNFAGLARHIKAWDSETMTARERAASLKHIANAVQSSPGFREVLRQILLESTES